MSEWDLYLNGLEQPQPVVARRLVIGPSGTLAAVGNEGDPDTVLHAWAAGVWTSVHRVSPL
jgi:hypothetical protein